MDIMTSQKETKQAQVVELLTTGKIDQREAGKGWQSACGKSSALSGATE